MKKGFSLPLWVTASAKSAVKKLLGFSFESYELITIPSSNETVKLQVHSSALINNNSSAIAIAFVDSGLDLDLTQNLEIWTRASFSQISSNQMKEEDLITLIPGYGVGINKKTSQICISKFARELIYKNLKDIIPKGFYLNLEIIFPNGKFLAERTSNKSFGIVEGLSIIGMTAETHLSASPDQLQNAKLELDKVISRDFDGIITFVIGENGLDLARQHLHSPFIKVGNWIGPLFVYAATKNVKEILLIGYHGKIIKLAGGIFHTHNHLADARIEILIYLSIKSKLPIKLIKQLSNSSTLDEALSIMEVSSPQMVNNLFNQIAIEAEKRTFNYIQRYLVSNMKIGVAMFDRNRKIRWFGSNGECLYSKNRNLDID